MSSKHSFISIGILIIMAVAYFSLKNSQYDPSVVIQPDTDKKSYQYLELPNKLRVLLISDPETDKAAAALDVHVGSLQDPKDRQGLAHFLEHMLFLGTEEYPEAGEYQEFISKNGGSHNAFTSSEHTNYFFEVEKGALEPALDRFSSFFKTPLLDEKYVDREKNAVHSEYQAKLKDDVRRNYEVIREIINPEHPASKFSVGSLDTLSDTEDSPIQDDLKTFYNKYYSANLMTLVVLGKEDLATLKQWVEEKFAAVPNHDTKLDSIQQPLFKEGTLPAEVYINPIKNTRSLSLVFPVEPLTAHYREKPVQYLSNLIGHEGKGSLLSELKARGWADSLSAGSGFNNLEYATFNITVKLTQEGLAHYQEIVSEVFAYIELLKQEGPQQWIFEEQSSLNNIAFRFQEQASPRQTVSHLAGNLQRYTAREVIRGPYLMARYDAKLITRYLEQLTPDNVLVTVAEPNLPTDKKSPWYQTPYSVKPLTEDVLASWKNVTPNERLTLPEKNQFVPEHLTLLENPEITETPIKLVEKDGFTLWHRTNLEFDSPKADIFINIRSPQANNTAANGVAGNLFAKMINDSLNEYSYPAYLAGLDYTLYRNSRGITIKVSGYSEKLETLLTTVIDSMFNAPLREERFNIYKDELLRAYHNEAKDKPYSLAYKKLVTLLMSSSWSLEERLTALEPMTLADIQAYRDQIFKDVEVVMLTHGNLSQDESKTIAADVQAILFQNSNSTQVAPQQVVKLKEGEITGFNLDTQHNDSVLLAYYQGQEATYEERALAGLISQVLSSPFYSEIRTEKQRGYIVFATPIPLAQVPGFTFITQSHVVGPKTLSNDYQSFLVTYRDTLSQMSAEEFEQHKSALISKLKEKPQRLSQLSDRYWQEIDQELTEFDTRERLSNAIEAISREELVSFYDRFFFGQESRELLIQYQGQSLTPENAELIEVKHTIQNPKTFKQTHPTF